MQKRKNTRRPLARVPLSSVRVPVSQKRSKWARLKRWALTPTKKTIALTATMGFLSLMTIRAGLEQKKAVKETKALITKTQQAYAATTDTQQRFIAKEMKKIIALKPKQRKEAYDMLCLEYVYLFGSKKLPLSTLTVFTELEDRLLRTNPTRVVAAQRAARDWHEVESNELKQIIKESRQSVRRSGKGKQVPHDDRRDAG